MLEEVRFNADGLVAVIARDATDGEVLMLAWMNDEALRETVASGRAVYYSRSRARLWHKGEESGNSQLVKSIRLDCDGDTVLLDVEQRGGVACHTGRRHCFYRQLDEHGQWQVVEPVKVDPAALYGRQS